MFGASTCIQMPRGQAALGICPRLLSAKHQAVSSQQARKSQGLLRGRDRHALSWPEAARLPGPLRVVVSAKERPLGGLQGTWELLEQLVAVWGREAGRLLPLGPEPLPSPCQAPAKPGSGFPLPASSRVFGEGPEAFTAPLSRILAVVTEEA